MIPAIDLKDGRCVRLFKGEFEQVTRYEQDPLKLATAYREAGCKLLHVVDLDGARDGRPVNEKIIRSLGTVPGLALQVGGGLRNEALVEAVLESGVSRVVLGSVAMVRPQAVADWLLDYGIGRVVLALDVRLDLGGVPRLASHGWTRETGQDLWSALEFFVKAGLRHVLCTDIDRDGAMTGPTLDLYRQCVARYPKVAFQASGGVRHVGDLGALEDVGVHAAIVGKALLDGNIKLEELGPFLQDD
ncbi:MAG: 1-(5-phosphoribosyl)-5-[(5-phosphoribosylamino)methylideneamino] imidazole-4-carboxamide isomerase [Gammaproteobacteria bacterium]|nr:1-(5-phosphoribosyl)-5-[(5-phosphoribosylamino)methylideneamino] imidazole-4-carboxamide isomerase [Gammaproteobacteria bacterium]